MRFRFPWRVSKTVRVPVWRGGTLIMPEPAWCVGTCHTQIAEHPSDFRHEGVEIPLVVHVAGRSFETLPVTLVQEPFADRDTLPHVSIHLGEDFARFTRDELVEFADGLVRHAEYLRGFADEVEELRQALTEARRPAGMPASLPWPPVDEDGDDE